MSLVNPGLALSGAPSHSAPPALDGRGPELQACAGREHRGGVRLEVCRRESLWCWWLRGGCRDGTAVPQCTSAGEGTWASSEKAARDSRRPDPTPPWTPTQGAWAWGWRHSDHQSSARSSRHFPPRVLVLRAEQRPGALLGPSAPLSRRAGPAAAGAGRPKGQGQGLGGMDPGEGSCQLSLTRGAPRGSASPGALAPLSLPLGEAPAPQPCVWSAGMRVWASSHTQPVCPGIGAGRIPQNSPPAQRAEQKGEAPLEKAVLSLYSRIPECSL